MSVLFDMITALVAALIAAALTHFGGAHEAVPQDPPALHGAPSPTQDTPDTPKDGPEDAE